MAAFCPGTTTLLRETTFLRKERKTGPRNIAHFVRQLPTGTEKHPSWADRSDLFVDACERRIAA